MAGLSILIVDDHAVVRQGLKQILTEEFPKVQFGEAGNGPDALDLARGRNWDVIILDIFLPGRSGLDLLTDLKAISDERPILVYSMHPEEQFAVRSLTLGAAGYVSKSDLPEQLIA